MFQNNIPEALPIQNRQHSVNESGDDEEMENGSKDEQMELGLEDNPTSYPKDNTITDNHPQLMVQYPRPP